MSKYEFYFKANANVISRMYSDHGYTVEEICFRLRYAQDEVEFIIKKFDLKHGEKSWRY